MASASGRFVVKLLDISDIIPGFSTCSILEKFGSNVHDLAVDLSLFDPRSNVNYGGHPLSPLEHAWWALSAEARSIAAISSNLKKLILQSQVRLI